jgi:hypothetical protein
VRGCVLFGPTLADYFAYPMNINLRPAECGGCWWINQTWMDQCPRGFPEAVCMTGHDPEHVGRDDRRNAAFCSAETGNGGATSVIEMRERLIHIEDKLSILLGRVPD